MGIDLGLWGAGIGVGLAVIGGGLGIAKLAAAALEGIARQPEQAGNLRITGIIFAALIEGLAFFGVIWAGNVASGTLDKTVPVIQQTIEAHGGGHGHKDGAPKPE